MRALARKLQAAWGQPWIVDNRAGGSGQIGMPVVARLANQPMGLVAKERRKYPSVAELRAKLAKSGIEKWPPASRKSCSSGSPAT